ncbi:HdeD family acid-resistance protein [Olivibacter sp. XZL3]|uniref:HdeD family acid-resistance protein n=1 Tax=Olivibacter sp. XZL3 TaxID=1735116 RepID=UPI001064641C|nr:DUF308 domain-containing protein [Olivibacter sp. XZL3]
MKSSIDKNVKYWYIPLILGILFLGLGFFAIATPVNTFLTVAFMFSVGFIVSGTVEMAYSLSNRKTLRNWGWYFAGGIITFLLGLLLSIRLDLSAILLSLYIGFWLLFRSIMYVMTSVELRDNGSKSWGWIFVMGVLGTIFSFILLWNPLITGVGFVFWIGFGLIALGIINIILGFSLRKLIKTQTNF